MAASVSFNGNAVNQKLDVFVKSQLPWLASKTLQGLAQQVKKDLQKEMAMTFDNYSAFTRNSIGIKPATKASVIRSTNRGDTEVFHKDASAVRRGGKNQGALKGNAAADYLKPQVLGGPVYLTRFQKRLKARGFLGGSQGKYMLPIKGGQVGWGKMNKGEYVRAGWGIGSFEDLRLSGNYGRTNYRTKGSYMFIPRNLAQLAESAGAFGDNQLAARAGLARRLNKGEIPPAGIYRVNKKSLTKVFQMLDDVPSVSAKYKFRPTADRSVQGNFDRIFNEQVRKYVR